MTAMIINLWLEPSMARNATIMTTITMMEGWFMTTILHHKEFGEDDDMEAATMMLMLMLMLVMLMLMMSIFLCGCECIDLSPDLRHKF